MKAVSRVGFFVLLIFLVMATSVIKGETSEAISVIPRPVKAELREGTFVLTQETLILVTAGSEDVGEYLSELVSAATAFKLEVKKISPARGQTNSIILRTGPEQGNLGDEGYRLSVGRDRVVIRASTEAGALYGVQSLRQLLPVEIERGSEVREITAWQIPCVEIEDKPRFQWRGLMLDCSRTFWSKAFVLRTIRLMSLYKLNRLHLHLTDDQGWRLEIKKHPALTEIGSKFAEQYNEPDEWEGYYSQSDMREIIAYGKRHNVTIVPEIEMPGHSIATLAVYPELSCSGGPFEIFPFFKGPGINKDILCAGNEKTFEFLEDVLEEVVDLFGCEFVHIGGDEAPKDRWRECSKCQRRIREEGLADEDELQSYFIKRIEKFLNSKGKRLIGWDEILEGGLAPNAAVMSWRGVRGGITAARAGHDVVMSPTSHCYFDYDYNKISTMKAYSYEPVPAEVSGEQVKHILGAQANFWSHIDRTEAGMDRQIFPRLLAVAEVTWSPKEQRERKDFARRVRINCSRLKELGVRYFEDPSVVQAWSQGICEAGELTSKRYVESARNFADTVVNHGRDVYGKEKTPLFVDGLHSETLAPVKWECRGQTWVLSNFASQQPFVRLLDGLTGITGEEKYRRAAEDATRYALAHLQSANGLLYWGGHTAWDLEGDRVVSQYPKGNVHEFKNHLPYYRLMWKVDSESARRLMEMVWAGHIINWELLDYNRHADAEKKMQPKWDSEFNEDIEVPFATNGNNLSFCNVTPSLMHSGVMLSVLDRNEDVLLWARCLIYRWQQGRDPKTGLCGGQLSYRKNDRAQTALGHVHPTINEARIVGCYHQSSRYHLLPLAQMQAGETLIAAGGKYAEVGREFINWAGEDLEVYGRHSYDAEKGVFVAVMTDGTPIKWQSTKKGYYIPESFAPLKGDGFVVWGYAMGYRLTGGKSHWQMLRRLFVRSGLGELGATDGSGRALCFDTDNSDWRIIYALLELYSTTKDKAILRLACSVADNLLEMQSKSGLFPRTGREYARTGDDIPLAILHLGGAIEGKRMLLPAAILDRRFFHCEYHGELEEYQKKRDDERTYDHYVFYGQD